MGRVCCKTASVTSSVSFYDAYKWIKPSFDIEWVPRSGYIKENAHSEAHIASYNLIIFNAHRTNYIFNDRPLLFWLLG